jgi:hypothetical protein
MLRKSFLPFCPVNMNFAGRTGLTNLISVMNTTVPVTVPATIDFLANELICNTTLKERFVTTTVMPETKLQISEKYIYRFQFQNEFLSRFLDDDFYSIYQLRNDAYVTLIEDNKEGCSLEKYIKDEVSVEIDKKITEYFNSIPIKDNSTRSWIGANFEWCLRNGDFQKLILKNSHGTRQVFFAI